MSDSSSSFEVGQRVRQIDYGQGMARRSELMGLGTVKKVNPKSCMVEFNKLWHPSGIEKCQPFTRCIPTRCLERVRFDG